MEPKNEPRAPPLHYVIIALMRKWMRKKCIDCQPTTLSCDSFPLEIG